MSSVRLRGGTASCSGPRWQPLKNAPAKVNPAALRNARRLGPLPTASLVSDMRRSLASMMTGGAVVGGPDRPARHSVFFGVAVALDAPPHRQVLDLADSLHGL